MEKDLKSQKRERKRGKDLLKLSALRSFCRSPGGFQKEFSILFILDALNGTAE